MKINNMKKEKNAGSPVKVSVCICPLTEDEKNANIQESISFQDNEVKLSMGEGKGQKTYEVDYEVYYGKEILLTKYLISPRNLIPFYFGSDSSNLKVSSVRDVAESIGNIILDDAFAGYNSTLFTFGAKSTGKSTVLYGQKSDHGIVWQILKGLFQMAEGCEVDTSFRCEISYFELCGNMITDLISKRGNIKSSEGVVKLKVKEDPTRGVYIEKLSRHIVTDMDEAMKLLNKGSKNRSRLAALDPNSKETSHCLFSIIFTQARINEGLPMELVSKINIVDLASKDGYTGYMNGFKQVIGDDDDEIEEEKGPLEVLQDVIKSLAGQNYGSINPMRSYGSVNPTSHIPYKDSSLTLLMKDSLGGNCQTTMMCCLSASQKSLRDNLNTLKYANLARHIKNNPQINEDQNVKLIRELKDEIEQLKTQPAEKKSKDAIRKLQRDQDLMNRLTGIWEEKWSIAQKMFEDKTLAVTDLGGGKGMKFETKEPHFVSLGGGRLSVGVSIIPVQRGFTRVGSGGEGYEVDMLVRGKGIASEHCLIEYDGEAVVLHPKNELVSVDGIPLSEPTRLPQGSMVCIGQNNYFRFNHPKEAAQIKEQYKCSRFSIVPDGVYPDVQLAIEQRRKEMQEREVLKAENKRLLAMEQQYVQSLEKLEFEKEQLEHEKTKLQLLQQQQQNVANQFDRSVSIQIEELKIHKEELKRLQLEKNKVLEKEKEIELAASKLDEERNKKEQQQESERNRILSEQASLDLEEFEALEKTLTNSIKDSNGNTLTAKAMALVNDKHNLALMELDILTNDLEYHDQFQNQREEIEKEKERLGKMEEQHKELETVLSDQIQRLQKDREIELSKIETEKKRLKELEIQQNTAIELIEIERQNLMLAKECEKEKLEKEREEIDEFENERMRALQKAVDEQEKEKEMIEREKMRLIDLEEEHKRALDELHRDMISQQEKLERERKLELEYIETEQLMLEELEHKQFESARQIEYEAQLIREQVSREKEGERKKMEANERYIMEIRKQQEMALRQAEEERRKMQLRREEEQRQLKEERQLLATRANEYSELTRNLEDEKERLRSQFQKEKEAEVARVREEMTRNQTPSPSGMTSNRTFQTEAEKQMIMRSRSPEGKMQTIEEERLRLMELKRHAAEKAEVEWLEKKKDEEKRELEEKEIELKKDELARMKLEQELKAESERKLLQVETEKMKKHEDLLKQREAELAELHKERARREELEELLETRKLQQNILDQTLNQEKEKLTTLERNFAEERSRRLEIEKRLQMEESRNRNSENEKPEKKAHDSRSVGNGITSNGTLKRKTPSYNLSLRSGHSSGNAEETNLLHHILALGHVVDNCPEIKVNRYSCRGYLQKMGKSRLKISWKRRWFVFDRKLRALCYYQDERKTKSKGILYFQSIQEVYVDSTVKRSPNPKTTFCIRTPTRPYVLSAPSAIAMSIWIDVICTGKEGVFISMGI